MASPSGKDNRGKETRGKEKPRLDVSTPSPALSHNPFAALAGAAAPLPSSPAPAAAPSASAVARPVAAAAPSPPKSRGRLILRRETKHRGGKTVVVVSGFAQLPGIAERELEELLSGLKQRLGCGGTLDGRELVVQGDRPAQVAAILREQGFRVDGVTG